MVFGSGKKGSLFFTIDTIIAALIVTLTIIIVVSFYTNEPVSEDSKQVIDNLAAYIAHTTVRQLRSETNYIYFDPNETEEDLYLHQKVSSLLTQGRLQNASSLAGNLSAVNVPPQYGVLYMIDGTTVYVRLNGNEARTRTNLTMRILTYYLNDSGSMIGPSTTKLSVWI